jgi:hypothetical protein
MTTVHDADTGEEVTNVTDAVIYLRVNSVNEAAITYYEKDHSKKTAISANPEVDVLAMERHYWLDTVVSQALTEVSQRCTERITALQYEEVQGIGAALISDIERHFRSNETVLTN